ncbi:MAG: hypothetical protein M3389_11850 [Actinomycetota bacterium]|nr:hypothetical protein [Actinomycetota bacterium]
MRSRITLAALAAAVTAVMFVPAPASAEAGCPDNMSPVPASFVQNGDKKDKEPRDGLVCAKPAPECVFTGQCQGGPDNDLYGLPLLGLDGKYYYVTDNSF